MTSTLTSEEAKWAMSEEMAMAFPERHAEAGVPAEKVDRARALRAAETRKPTSSGI